MDLSVIGVGLKILGRSMKSKAPEILTALGIVGLGSTTVLAAKAAPFASSTITDAKIEIMDIENDDSLSEEESKEKVKDVKVKAVKAVVKNYIPTAISFVLTGGCIIGSNRASASQKAALVTACTMAEQKLADYDKIVKENVSDKKFQDIRAAKAQQQLNEAGNQDPIKTGHGDVLFMESITGQMFYSSVTHIDAIVNEINQRLIGSMDGFQSLNELLFELDLNTSEIGDDIGWTEPLKQEYHHTTTSKHEDDFRGVVVLDWRVYPTPRDKADERYL